MFAPGARARLAGELDRAGIARALLLCTAGHRTQAEQIVAPLGERIVGIFPGALMHVPIESVHAARAYAQRAGADGCIAIGGGSTIGLAKAIALATALPIVALPTTYSGSEMTPIYGITENSLKTTGRDERVLPRTVIYDPELTLDLPRELSAASGLNAIAHAVEGLYAQDGNPIVALMAEESIAALARALPRIRRDPLDLEARSDALYGAWLAGSVLGAVGMALHHKLCHTLGGTFGLPHAQTHAIVLPYAAAYNAPFARDAMARAARALTGDPAGDATAALFALARSLRVPASLAVLGLRADQLDHAADLATRNPYANPRPVERAAIRELLQRAFDGTPPQPQSE